MSHAGFISSTVCFGELLQARRAPTHLAVRECHKRLSPQPSSVVFALQSVEVVAATMSLNPKLKSYVDSSQEAYHGVGLVTLRPMWWGFLRLVCPNLEGLWLA